MKRFLIFLVIGILLPVFSQVSWATFIRMESTVTTDLKDNKAKIAVMLTNKGDEPAYNVRISAEIDGKAQAGPLKDILMVDEKYSGEFTAEVAYKKPGKYPAIIKVDYTDRNEYPFMVNDIASLNYKETPVGGVVGKLTATPVAGKGRLKAQITNLGQEEKALNVRLVIPEGLTTSNPRREITIKPGSEETLVFDIKNITALAGSNYQAFAILEHEDEKYHYANVLSGAIEIEREKEMKEILYAYKWPLMAVVLIFTGGVVYFNLRKR